MNLDQTMRVTQLLSVHDDIQAISEGDDGVITLTAPNLKIYINANAGIGWFARGKVGGLVSIRSLRHDGKQCCIHHEGLVSRERFREVAGI